jgi:ABC transport system ATP-binding/permease protein
MHYATIENLTKAFGARILFRNISFYIEEGDKIALIARNGSGKSTLLKIIAGLETPDEGTIWIHKDVKVIMLQQDQAFEEEKSIWDNILNMDNPVARLVKEYERISESGKHDEIRFNYLIAELSEKNAWNFENDVKQILGKLELNNLDEPIKNLSGGQRKRVALAQVLVESQLHEEKNLLILDEPTNHLDIDMIEWLERFLATHKSTLLLVTHDRYFIDELCEEILEIEDEKIYVHKGKYDYSLEKKLLREEVSNSEWLKDRNIFRKELEWMRKQPRARTTKSKSREDAFAVLNDKLGQQKKINDISLDVQISRLGGKILEMKKVYKAYGKTAILKGFDYTFKKGERIGIVGKNGTGKSTFLNIALGLLPPDSGKVSHGETVVFGNFDQQGLYYKEDKRAIEYVKTFAEFFPLADGTKVSAGQFMEKFGFSSHQQFTYLSKLSGGEKRRLQLLSILFRNPNFLVLDEPTNDLDLQTLSTLEEFLQNFNGCLLIVSHDRYFMDRLVDHLFAFEGEGIIKDFPGNYTQFRAWKDGLEKIPDKIKPVSFSSKPAKNPSEKITFKEKYEYEQLEKELPELEKERQMLEQQISAGNLPFEELGKIAERIGIIINLLDEKETRWLELSEKLLD